MSGMGFTSVDAMIKRTIEANASYVKSPELKNSMVEKLAPVVSVCFQDHSPERTKLLQSAFDIIDGILIRESPLVSWMYYLMSDARKRDGQYQSAVDYAMESLKLREEIYGEDSNELCRECVSLAVSIKELKEYPLALQLLERAKTLISTPIPKEVDPRKSVIDITLSSTYGGGTSNDANNDKADKQERDSVKLQILFVMGSIYEIMGNMDKLLSVYENLLDIYTSTREQETVRDVATTYEYLLRTYFSLERYHLIRPSVSNLLQYVSQVDGWSSVNMAIALRIAANNFRELSDTNSPTKLCDFADSVRYYICTIKIAMELTGEEREQVGVVDLSFITEARPVTTPKNVPLRKEECVVIVDKLLTIPLDTLMDGTKTQNQFLKVVLPNFMAEDALREKAETIPTKSGVLYKYGLVKSWKSRFFVVDRDTFYYYEFPTDPKPQGEYNLLEIKHIEVLPVEKKYKPHTHCFSLVTPKRNVVLACDSQEVMQEWVHTLTKAKAYWEEWYAPI